MVSKAELRHDRKEYLKLVNTINYDRVQEISVFCDMMNKHKEKDNFINNDILKAWDRLSRRQFEEEELASFGQLFFEW